MPITIGIDLGTTNTAVSYMQNGRPVMLQNEKGYTVFPSIVFWDRNGDIILGRRARSKMLTHPERGVFAVKRLMGLRHDSQKVAGIQKRIPYQISASADGMCTVRAAGKEHSPVDVAALILKEAKNIAEYALDEEVTGVVITVPAHFNHAQRDMTKKAAIQAGLRCDLIINEPTAAALAYGFRQDAEKKVLVYDLGGGTFDVSLLQFDVGVVETLATRGDTFLGGEDFDARIIDHIAEHFLAQSGVDLRDDQIAYLRLKDAAEAAKCELSFKEKTKIYIPQIHEGQSVELMYTRAELEESTEDLISKTLDVVRQTLEDSKTRISQVDEVLLVGGQSRMPRIQQAVSNLFNKKPSRGVNPDEAVAIGAAVRAGSMDDPSKAGPVLLDVTPFDLGIDISGGLFEKVILRNSKVPTAVTKTFSAVRHNQKVIRIVVRQGESRIASENEFLGEFRMSDLSRGTRGAISVDVTFEIDSSGMLKVRAVEPQTGEAADITVRNYGEFTQGSATSLSVEQHAHKGVAPTIAPVDEIFAEEDDEPQSENENIQKKVGFFGRLFGSKKKPSSNRLELEEGPEELSEEEVIPVAEAVEELSEDDLILEDIFEEKPAQQGLANSSFAVDGQEQEEAEVTFVEVAEEEEDISSYLAVQQDDTVTELELDDLLLELDGDSEDLVEDGDIEGTLDDLLEDLDATMMIERTASPQPELPSANEESVEELDLEFLEEIEEQAIEQESVLVEDSSEEEQAAPEAVEETEESVEELELSFLDVEEPVAAEEVQEIAITLSEEEEAEEELDLSFLEEEEEKEESVEEIELELIEERDDHPQSDTGVEETEELEEEIDLSFLEEEEVKEESAEEIELTLSKEEESAEELDLSFLDEEAVEEPVAAEEVQEIAITLSEEEEAEEEVDLSFLEDSGVEEPAELNEEEAEEEIDLSFLEDTVEEENVIEEGGEEDEEIDLALIEEPDARSDTVVEEPDTGEELDLGFLDDEPVEVVESSPEVTQEEIDLPEEVVDEAIDLSSLGEEEPKEEVIPENTEEVSTLTLQKEDSSPSVPARNEVIQSFLAANAQQSDVFSIQEDDFFAEESSTKFEEQPEHDEEVEIPNASNPEDEEEIDLDFFEDLFDD